MTNEQIKEKYSIEPIMKEMWVWDRIIENAVLKLVLYKKRWRNVDYPFTSISDNRLIEGWKNASETNPNYKEIKVGDKGYFWDIIQEDNSTYLFGELINISGNKFMSDLGIFFPNFSHTKQAWMQ